MKAPIRSTVAALLLSFTAVPGWAASFAAHEVLIVSRPGDALVPGTDGVLRTTRVDAEAVLQRHGLTRWTPIGPLAENEPMFFRAISDRPGFDPVLAAREIVRSGMARAAIPNYRLRLFLTLPNDPYRESDQWWIHAANDADIDLPEAWDVTRGDTSVVIGIVDTGVDPGHPDLAAQIWTNRGEVPANAVDDDGNGYVDDVHGWDFGDGDADPNPDPFIDPEFGVDIGFHGTFTAGIASAATDNGEGIAGAGWKCRIMPLHVSDVNNDITSAALAEAFLYAARIGADVLEPESRSPPDSGVAEYFQELVDLAPGRGRRVRRRRRQRRHEPADLSRRVRGRHRGRRHRRGESSRLVLELGTVGGRRRPGAAMWSALCRNYEIDEFSQLFYEVFFGWDTVNPYLGGDGTSFASPLVAGTCALVRSVWPSLSGSAMEQYLKATGDVVAYDHPIGMKVNARAAVTVPAAVSHSALDPRVRLGPAVPQPMRSEVNVSFTLPSATEATVRVFDAQGRLVRELWRGALAGGRHQVTWDRKSSAGSRVASGIYLLVLDAGGQREGMKLVVP